MNVHLQCPEYGIPTVDYFYSGTKATLAGGTTMVVDMVVPDNGDTLLGLMTNGVAGQITKFDVTMT